MWQHHKDEAPGQTHLLSTLLACRSTFRASSGAAQLVLMVVNSMCTQCTEVHSTALLLLCSANRSWDSLKPVPGPFALADISYDLCQVDKNAWNETEMSLATGADGICGLPELREITSMSGTVNMRCLLLEGPCSRPHGSLHYGGRVLTTPLPPARLW